VKLSLKILVPVFVVLALVCFGIGFLTGSSFTETIESTIFVLIAVFILIFLPVAWLCSRRPWLHNLRLHRPPPFSDPQLGQLRFSFGFTTCLWRGSIALLPGTSLPLTVAGTANGPAPEALAMARDLVTRFPSWRPSIEKALFEHYEPYAEALASGELKHLGEPLPVISEPSNVWPLISWVYASVAPLGGSLVIELGVTVPWDEEHTLGLRFEAGRFLELCGSV
jgi:Domain of unknown function (DUF6985)